MPFHRMQTENVRPEPDRVLVEIADYVTETVITSTEAYTTADDYEDTRASDPQVDLLRAKMVVEEDTRYSQDYLDPDKRSIANAVQVFFQDGTATEKRGIEYPLGHRRRRTEGRVALEAKLVANLRTRFPEKHVQELLKVCLDQQKLEAMAVQDFVGLFVS